MELFSTDFHYIIQNEASALWINRHTGHFLSRTGVSPISTGGSCLGTVYGFIGKLQFGESAEPRLVFIRQRTLVGTLRGCDIYKIDSVVTVALESDTELLLEPCHKDHKKQRGSGEAPANPIITTTSEIVGTKALLKVKPTPAAPRGSEQHVVPPKRPERIDKVERRMLDEFGKMFSEADSFYYSEHYDLTSSVQRSVSTPEKTDKQHHLPLWYIADTRFFWNHYMMSDLMQEKDAGLDEWILPIMQGFIQFERCNIDHLFDPIGPGVITVRADIDLWIISRRSRFRAGTRYLRRGIDENGKVANYVETEQIMIFKKHILSFVQTRGSIPVFWSQPGFRYRPPPRLDGSEEENYSAFRKHIEEEGGTYGPLALVNLVEKNGKEKVLGDAYLSNVLRHNSPDISYFTFDFHEHCRGMHFENVQFLIDKLEEKLKEMNYCWVDTYGVVQKQSGVCRINCVDCLDRTNVVQTLLGKHILCLQMSKLGLLANWEVGLSEKVKRKLQSMWANNGDTISKQYAGTNALKSDYTRTGERRIAGAFKDGINSANRYYLNRFRDASRQAALDIMLGIRKNITEDDLDGEKAGEERENTAEQIKMVIEDAKKCILPKFDVVLGSWGLVNAKENDPDTIDVDAIFVVTEHHYYVTEYDCTMDAITETEKVHLRAIHSLEIGFEPLIQPGSFWTVVGLGNAPQAGTVPSLRINYIHNKENYFHQFRSSNVRFFNNVCVPIQHPEEMFEALKMIADTVQSAASAHGNKVKLTQTAVLPPRVFHKQNTTPTSSWVHRYFSGFGGPENDSGSDNGRPKRISTVASFERFKPRFFRRASAADVAAKRESGRLGVATHVESVTGIPKKLLPGGYAEDQILTTIDPSLSVGFNSSGEEHEPMISNNIILEGSSGSQTRLTSGDLVLASCGVLAISSVSAHHVTGPSRSPPPLLTPELQRRLVLRCDTELRTPCSGSPNSQPSSPDQLGGLKAESLSEGSSLLSRHRHSLPTPSLGIPAARRPITPEIKITEEPILEGPLLLPVSVIPKRISRSSEDVTKVLGSESAKAVPIGRFTSELMPLPSEGVRSTSEQDLCGAVGNTMKGSHSDNAIIRSNNPFQRFAQNASTGHPPFKKDLVLVPLGKLARGMQSIGANYLHPKKLRDTFKPQAKKETEMMREEDLGELRLLEGKKRNCKSLIIDL